MDDRYKPRKETFSEPLRRILPRLNLMLLGKTGSGKSSLGNAILNLNGPNTFTVTHGFAATECTAEVKCAEAHNRIVKVVDTPGVHCTTIDSIEDELDVLKKIGDGVSRCSDGVDVFLIIMRLDVRFTKEEFSTVSKLEAIFGSNVWRHVILVFTHGEYVGNDAEGFQKLITAGKTIPSFKSVLLKINTDPIVIDLSSNRTSEVFNHQITRLMFCVDMLVRENKCKYTGELFVQAQKLLEEQRAIELQVERDKACSELNELKQTVANLEKLREDDRKRMEDLELQAMDADAKLKAALEKTSDVIAESARKKACHIL